MSLMHDHASLCDADLGRAITRQVSGLKFKFDPTKPPGHRIDAQQIWVGQEEVCHPLSPSKLYSVATKSYLTSGKDGFDCMQVLPYHEH